MSKRDHRRTRFVVDSFQYRLIAVILVHFLTILAVFAGSVFLPLMFKMDNVGLSFQQREDIANQFLALHSRFWPALAIVVVLVILHSVITSHRIAGPVYRMRKMLRAVGKGDFTVRAVFRKDDYLAKEARSINLMVESLGAKIGRLRASAEEASSVLAELRGSFNDITIEEMERKSEIVATHLSEIKQCVSAFKIDPNPPPIIADNGDDFADDRLAAEEQETTTTLS